MEHRHLLPNEFDLLVDGEEGFGVAPLQAHVASCPGCRAELDVQRQLVASLDRLPQCTPSPLFAHRVMSQVQVFEPWHVAALDSVRRLVPRSRPARVLAGATAGLVATTVTLATFWMANRLDVVAFLVSVTTERVRSVAMSMGSSLVSSALGEGAAQALKGTGNAGLVLALAGFLLTVLVAAFGLRAVATASRRRRM